MFKRLLPTALTGYVLLVIVNWSCTKLDTTTLGSDLIPAVDNVYTFADTLDIISTQGIFDDTFKISRSETNVLGKITSDPLFGQTQANMYFQVKPTFFPYYFGNARDTLVAVDSVVLCLAYGGFWGDSSQAQHLEVFRISDDMFADSSQIFRTIKYQPTISGGPIGAVDVNVRTLKDTLRLRKDSVTNQIRIKLSNAFAQELFSRDSINASPLTIQNAFRNDSIYRKFDKGFAVIPSSGNGLMYISLSDARSRMEVHYKRKMANTGVLDSTFNSFTVNINGNFNGTNIASASSNFIQRIYSAALQSAVGQPTSPDIYLSTGPGTYANLRIPELDTMSNKIVHRAEIYMEQDPDPTPNTDSIFSAPNYLYLDLIDTPGVKWKPIYYDLSPNEPYDPDFKRAGYPYFPGNGGVDFSYFGGFARKRINYLGEKVVYYTINATRHVQQILSKRTPNYGMRLYPAYSILYPQYANALPIAYNNPVALGRVRLKSGSHPDPLRRMRMVIIYSKI